MFIHYLRFCCITFILFIFTSNSYADVYKWVDDKGQVHYSQQPPSGQQADEIKAPPPPAIDPEKAQKELDKLIKQQSADEKTRQGKNAKAEKEREIANQNKQNCRAAQQNMQAYKDNPGRRLMDKDGNVTRPTEEERQQKIKESQQKVNEFCK